MGRARRHWDRMSVVGVMTAAAMKARRMMYFRFLTSMADVMKSSLARTMRTSGRLKRTPKGRTSMKTKFKSSIRMKTSSVMTSTRTSPWPASCFTIS